MFAGRHHRTILSSLSLRHHPRVPPSFGHLGRRLASTLSIWHEAVNRVPPEKILTGSDQKLEAFAGDKLLGASLAKWIQQRHKEKATLAQGEGEGGVEIYDQARATRLNNIIFSNKFMADRWVQILPDPIYQEWITNNAPVSQHTMGTVVEAAVAAVEDMKAVDDLVEWLVEQQSQALPMYNPKGKLLELGGRVTVERQGGDDHAPLFLAKATIEDVSIQATGSSKKTAEHSAASQCLSRLGYEGDAFLADERATLERPRENDGAWNKFNLKEEEEGKWTLRLSNEESLVGWWQRGASDPKKAFRRSLFGPSIFPESILSVDSWTRRFPSGTVSEDSAVAAILVIVFKGEQRRGGDPIIATWSATRTAASASKARSEVGLLGNAEISRILARD